MARGQFPFISFVGAYYFAFHGILAVYAAAFVEHLPFSGGIGMDALLFTCAFVAILYAGYVGASILFRPRREAATEEPVAPLVLLSFGLAGFHLLFAIVPALNSLPSVPQLRHPSWYCGFAILCYLFLGGRLRPCFGAALGLLTVVKLGLDARLGQITPLIFTLAILLSAAMLHRRYRWVAGCVVISAVIVGGYGYAKYFSRAVIFDRPVNILGFAPDASLKSAAASLSAMTRRSSHSLLTGHVISMTPETVPYSARDPLLDALRNHVPRIVWPDKPTERAGNAFGKRYGIISPLDDLTSWNLPWIVDFYTAYGPYRSLLYIFGVGAALGCGVRWMSSRRRRVFWFGTYTATLFPLFYQESNFSLMAGSLLWVVAFLLVAYAIARRVCRVAAAAAILNPRRSS